MSFKPYILAAVALTGVAVFGETKVVRVVPSAEASANADGESWATAYGDVKTAYESLGADGGEVWIKKGLHIMSNTVEMAANVSVYGGFAGTETARDQADPKNNLTLLTGDQELNDGFMNGSPRTWRYNQYRTMWDYETLTFNEVVPDYGWSDTYGANYDHYFWTPWPNKAGVSGLTTADANNQNVLNALRETGRAFEHLAGSPAIGKAVFEGLVFSGFKTNAIYAAGAALSATPYESEIEVRNCRFLGCVNGLAGYGSSEFCPVRVKDMPATVDGCEFNRCLNAVKWTGASLAITNEVAFTVTNCLFTYVTLASGAAVQGSTLGETAAAKTPRYLVADCTFDHLYRFSGGVCGVYADANGLVERCVFQNTRSHTAASVPIGFVSMKENSYCNDMEIRDCQFLDNYVDTATQAGAACCIACPQTWNKMTMVQTLNYKAPIVRNCYFANNKIRVTVGSNKTSPCDFGVCFQQGGLHANQKSGSGIFINCTAVSNCLEYAGSENTIYGHFAIFFGESLYVNCVVKDSQFINNGTGAAAPTFHEFYVCNGNPKFVNTVAYNDDEDSIYHFSSTPKFLYNTLGTKHQIGTDADENPVYDDLSGLSFSKPKPNPAGVPAICVRSSPDRRPGRVVWEIGNDIAIYDPAGNSGSPWMTWRGSRQKNAPSVLADGRNDTDHLIPDANGKDRFRMKNGVPVIGEALGPLCAEPVGMLVIFN